MHPNTFMGSNKLHQYKTGRNMSPELLLVNCLKLVYVNFDHTYLIWWCFFLLLYAAAMPWHTNTSYFVFLNNMTITGGVPTKDGCWTHISEPQSSTHMWAICNSDKNKCETKNWTFPKYSLLGHKFRKMRSLIQVAVFWDVMPCRVLLC
jgi:hypothetical protein